MCLRLLQCVCACVACSISICTYCLRRRPHDCRSRTCSSGAAAASAWVGISASAKRSQRARSACKCGIAVLGACALNTIRTHTETCTGWRMGEWKTHLDIYVTCAYIYGSLVWCFVRLRSLSPRHVYTPANYIVMYVIKMHPIFLRASSRLRVGKSVPFSSGDLNKSLYICGMYIFLGGYCTMIHMYGGFFGMRCTCGRCFP